MTTTANLNLTLIETNQSQKEVTANTAIAALDAALCEATDIECADGTNAVSAATMREVVHLCLIDSESPPTAEFYVELAAVKRLIAITNETAYEAIVVVADASSGAAEGHVDPGAGSLVYCDGTGVRQITFDPNIQPIPKTIAINAQSGTTYELQLGDEFVTCTNVSAITVTIPAEASVDFPIGSQILLAQLAIGQVTVVGGSIDVDIITPETTALAKTGASAALIKIAADTWLMTGNLEASA